MKNLALYLLEYALAIVIPVISGFVIKLIKEYSNRKKLDTTNQVIQESITLVESLVIQVVTFVSQTSVDALKKRGAFNEEEQIKAFDLAKETLLSLIPKNVYSILDSYFSDFDEWIDSKIEQAVYSLKNQ